MKSPLNPYKIHRWYKTPSPVVGPAPDGPAASPQYVGPVPEAAAVPVHCPGVGRRCLGTAKKRTGMWKKWHPEMDLKIHLPSGYLT